MDDFLLIVLSIMLIVGPAAVATVAWGNLTAVRGLVYTLVGLSGLVFIVAVYSVLEILYTRLGG